jgi:hypothetical protein
MKKNLENTVLRISAALKKKCNRGRSLKELHHCLSRSCKPDYAGFLNFGVGGGTA